MIHVIAIITTQPGKREEVLGHFRANVPAVHAEEGCIEYGPTVDADTGGIGTPAGAGHVLRDREMGELGGAEGAQPVARICRRMGRRRGRCWRRG